MQSRGHWGIGALGHWALHKKGGFKVTFCAEYLFFVQNGKDGLIGALLTLMNQTLEVYGV